MLTGENGIINRASEAKEKTELAQKEEEEKLDKYEAIMKEMNGETIYLKNYVTEETKPYLPSSKFSVVDGTDLSTGLVITDHKTNGVSDGNEYVWIEVPRTVTTYGNSFDLNYNFNNMTE